MPVVVVDVEADGPCVGKYSMVCFGACVVEPGFNRTFYGKTAPVSNSYIPEALAVSGFTREEHKAFPKPADTITQFHEWLDSLGEKPIFISDNPAFDWQWINYYFHVYGVGNPFGHSARRIGDLYAGATRNFRNTNDWKKS